MNAWNRTHACFLRATETYAKQVDVNMRILMSTYIFDLQLRRGEVQEADGGVLLKIQKIYKVHEVASLWMPLLDLHYTVF